MGYFPFVTASGGGGAPSGPAGGALSGTYPNPGAYANARRIFVDAYGADPTGAADSAVAVRSAQAAGGSSPYVLVFSVGTYLFDSAPSNLGLDQYVEGQGQFATYFSWSVAGPLWTVVEPGTFNGSHRAGRLSGFSIVGPQGSGGVAGITYAGLQSLQIDDVGFYGLDEYAVLGYKFGASDYAEEAVMTRLSVSECGATSGYVFRFTGTSFDYTSIDAVVVAEANIDIISVADNAQLQGLNLALRGNAHGAASNTGALVAIERGNTGGTGYLTNATFAVSMEADNPGGGTVGHYLLWMGSDNSASQFTAEGVFNLFAAGATCQGISNVNFLPIAFSGRSNDPSGGGMTAGDALAVLGGTDWTAANAQFGAPFMGNVYWQFGDIAAPLLASGNNTLTFNGANNFAKVLHLFLQQPASGAAGTVTWPGSVVWISGSAPVLATANGAIDQIDFIYLPVTSTYYGFRVKQPPSSSAPLALNQGGTGQVTAAAAFNALNPNAAPVNVKVATPTGTTSTTLVMLGCGSTCVYTPAGSGLVQVTLTAYVYNTTASTGIEIGGRYGTGSAPANGATVSGTRFGASAESYVRPSAATNTNSEAAAFTDILTLTPGSTYWFDLAFATTNATDLCTIYNVSMSFAELPAG